MGSNANNGGSGADTEEIAPYSMHVSSKYLDLTKKKLELTRLPRELELPEERRWDQGTPKAVLEPLLDYWLDSYDWRATEAHLNSTLPQYRTTITLPSNSNSSTSQALRIHFVYKRSSHQNAIPLLFCHTWPSSFIEVQKIIDALTEPQSLPSFGDGAQQAFDVVAPSIPGFGFSDAGEGEDFGLEGTAEAFARVMGRLGYERFVIHEPTFKKSPIAFLKYQIAKLTRASVASLSFGYVPLEVHDTAKQNSASQAAIRRSHASQGLIGPTLAHLYSQRPQTLAFSLCDSPIGLLAGLLDVIHYRTPSLSPITSRSRSPFLSPIEIEQQDSHHDRSSQETAFRATADGRAEQPLSPRESEVNSKNYSWSATEVLNWTMMQWLPGPRHQRPALLPAWEAPDLLVLDMREYFQSHASAIFNLPT
ncbi:hypothetical protein N0V90_008692 [Kalmusia sp. IMI 367209]|nr:hypothetical protein N0V90_008692 [Kalmusia sp. IMI 367209]